MKNIKNNIFITFVFLCLLVTNVNADYPIELEIATTQENINVGEPLILKVTLRFENPQLSEDKREILHRISPELVVRIYQGQDLSESIFNRSSQQDYLYPTEDKGFIYSGNIILLYDTSKDKLIFNSPGVYTITVHRTNKVFSKPLEINIKPASSRMNEMLSELSDANDFNFIILGSQKYFDGKPERIEFLRNFVDKNKDTTLAKLIAAELGLNYFDKFQKYYSNLPDVKKQIQTSGIKIPLLEQAHEYLTIASNLSSEFPIRENVLYQLITLEFLRDEYTNVSSLLDDLSKNYPHGRYGIRAERIKNEELKPLMENKSVKDKANKIPKQNSLGVALPIAGAAVAGIVITGVIMLFLRKKKLNKSE